MSAGALPVDAHCETQQSPQHKATAALSETAGAWEQFAREIFGALREPVLGTAQDGRVVLFNAAAVATLGPGERLYGSPINRVLPFVGDPASPDAAESPVWRGAIEHSDGRTLELEVSATALAGQGQGFTVYVLHDISAHVELSRLREHLLYAVAHELGSPLTLIGNTVELLVDELDILTPQEVRRLLEMARRTSQRAKILLEALLSAGNIKAGTFQVRPVPTLVREVIEGAVDVALPLANARGQVIDVEVPDGLRAYCDGEYTRQVVFNLLSNASKYSPCGEAIFVRAVPMEDAVRIAIEDHGPGLPPEERVRVFERFYRARDGTSATGVGLGLAIVKGIIEAHGGQIGIDSELGVGTSVWFTLPII